MAKPSKKTIKKSTTKKSSISKVDVPKTKEKNASSNSADKLDTKKLESKATKTASQVESSKDVEDLEKKIASLENEVKILESKKTKNPKQGGFFRKFGVFFFVFLSIVSLLLLDISFWAKDTILNNQSFVSTMEPLIQNKDVQEALTINISNAIFENINVEQLLKENLPEKATFLAAPLAAQIKSFTSSEINKLLASEKAAQVWTVVLQNSQKTLVSFIENSNSSGTITVNDLYKFAGNELQGSAVSFLFNKTIPDKIGQFQLTQVEWLPQAKQYINILKDLPYILSAVFVVSVLLAAILSRNRRKLFVVILPLYAVTMAVVLVALKIADGQVAAQVSSPNSKAASAVFEIITSPLRDQTIARLWLFVALFVGVLMISPYSWVKYCISKLRFSLDWLTKKILPKFSGPKWLNTISNSRFIISVVFVSVIFVIFNLKQPPNIDNVIWAGAISFIGLFILEVTSALSRASTKSKVK